MEEDREEVIGRVGEALCVCVTSDLCSGCMDDPDDPTYIWTRDGVTLSHTHHNTPLHTSTHTQLWPSFLFLPQAM